MKQNYSQVNKSRNKIEDYSDDDSILQEKNKSNYKINEITKGIQIINFRYLPMIFFLISTVLLSLILLKFYPNFRSSFSLTETYLKKYQIDYFSFSFKNLDRLSKVFFFK